MLSVFYFQRNGVEINEKNALEMIEKEDVGGEFKRALEIASELRNSWPRSSVWMASVRKAVVGPNIPQGRADLVAVNLFRERSVSRRMKADFIPSAIAGCRYLESVLDANR